MLSKESNTCYLTLPDADPRKLMEIAEEIERERCAKIAEDLENHHTSPSEWAIGYRSACRDIEKAILRGA